MIETDAEIHSLACYCFAKKELTVEVKVACSVPALGCSFSGLACSSYAPGESSSSNSLVVGACGNDKYKTIAWVYNFSGGVGQRFELGAAEFRLKVLEFSIATGYKYKFTKNDECRVTAICGKRLETNCLWLIHALDKFGVFAIRKINPIHTCGFACKDYNNPPMTSNLVKSLIMDSVSDTLSISVRTIIRYFKKEYGLIVKKHVAYMGKQLALKELYGEEGISYHQLVWNIPKYKVQRLLDGGNSKNGDQGLYPLAMGVVDGEDEANWYWFLDKFKGAFGYDKRYTFLRDRHHRLLVNIPLVFLGSYHSFCLWHLKNNLRAALSKTDSVSRHLVKLFSDCAYAPTHDKFQEKMIELRTIGDDQVDRFLARVPLENWANSCFRGSRYGEMCSSLAECFNSWVKGDRFLPITSMLDEIRKKMMNMATERRKDSKGWATILCPQMELKLTERIDKARSLDVIRSDDYVFQVISKNSEYRVDLISRYCTCNNWKIDGFPCIHAIASILCSGESVYGYIDIVFHTSSFYSCYSH
ncbi:hypothetical protein IFM89_016617, partial [Coptis chinensis]